ncbi:MAG: repair protein SbcC/Rad50 [Actinomycetota bacterium]|nr:repair protein SbcC/Rad50 [Actinomycetota bacterium]
MRVAELSLRNYRQFEEVDLELPARVIGIVGPNGSGKSTLMESIAVALYGIDAARTKKDQIRTSGLLTDCELRMIFEHGGSTYEVRRSITGKNHATDAELLVGSLQLASGVSDVDSEIARLLRMDRQVFRASVFAEQKQLDAFSDVTAGKRKEMVLRLLGIRPVDDARKVARKDGIDARKQAEQLGGVAADVTELDAAIKAAKDLDAEAAGVAKTAAADLKKATAAAAAATAAFEAADAARQEAETLTVRLGGLDRELAGQIANREKIGVRLETTREAVDQLPAMEAELASLVGSSDLLHAARQHRAKADERDALKRQLDDLPVSDPQGALAALEAATAAADDARAQAARAAATAEQHADLARQTADRLARAKEADPSEPCPTCGREMGKDFRAYLSHRKEEAATAKAQAAESARAAKAALTAMATADATLKRASAEGREAERSARDRTSLQERLNEATSALTALGTPFHGEVPEPSELTDKVERERALAADVARVRQQVEHRDQLIGDLAAADGRIAEIAADRARVAASLEALAYDSAGHASARDERAKADAALALARETERAATEVRGRAQAELAKLHGALEEAEKMAARVDELRSDARYRDRVATLLDGFRNHLVGRVGPELSREAESLFRELTNHEYDDLKIDDDTLNIHIADGDTYFDIDRFSGSETDLANLALRVAISMHLSRVSGADVGMLVLDEVLGSLDQERKDLMVQAMGRLSTRFHQLFVVTHADQVKDQFPVAVQISKTSRRRSSAVLI